MGTIIDALYEDLTNLNQVLAENKETSLQVSASSHLRKVLLLSAASYFEHRIQDIIVSFITQKTNGDAKAISFIKQKGVDRQYHTYFSWDDGNANRFFGLFGPEFREKMKAEAKNDAQFAESIKAFMELGQLRNELVHINFANYPLEKTAEEIYKLYKTAEKFVDRISERLK
jgi:hypothetical protein